MTAHALPSGRRLGKADAAPDPRDLLFGKYVDVEAVLPKLPANYGYDSVVAQDAWQMFGNGPDPGNPPVFRDGVGDCAWAGSAHETMLLTATQSTERPSPTMARFTTANVLSDYESTGFSPTDPNSDQGTDLHQLAKYRQQKGIVDSTGKRHKIGAYVWLTPGDFDQFRAALYCELAVGIGIQFPNSADDQFPGEWTVVPGAQVVGGHYVSGVSVRGHNSAGIVTWAEKILMSEGFYAKYNDETLAYIPLDALNAGGVTSRGFNMATLSTDLGLAKGV